MKNTTRVILPSITLINKWLSKLDRQSNGCLFWPGGLTSDGYGTVGYTTEEGPKTYLLHRVIWTIYKGDIPDGLLVLHSCDKLYPVDSVVYRKCVNIEHLYVGTELDNTADCISNGRKASCRGYNNGNAYLTADDVILIRKLYSEGYKVIDIGQLVGANPENVSKIALRRTWKHI